MRPVAGATHIHTHSKTFLDSWIPGQPGIITLDLMMPDISGLMVLEELRQIDPGVPVLAISASTSPSDAAQAMKLGALEYMEKPFDSDALRAHFINHIEYHDRRQQLVAMRNDVAQILSPLTEQECRTVFASIRWGSAKEAARVNGMSARTVETHRYNISQKLNLGSFNKVKATVSDYYYQALEMGIDPIHWLWIRNDLPESC